LFPEQLCSKFVPVLHGLQGRFADHLALEGTVRLRLKLLQKQRGAPVGRFALLDSDQTERDPQRAKRARKLAADNRIMIL
jgi:hypothetical protein